MDGNDRKCMQYLPIDSISQDYLQRLAKDYKLVVLKNGKPIGDKDSDEEDATEADLEAPSQRTPDTTSRILTFEYPENHTVNTSHETWSLGHGEKTPQKQIISEGRECPKLRYKFNTYEESQVWRDHERSTYMRQHGPNHSNAPRVPLAKKRCFSDSDIDEIVRPEIKRYTACGSPVFEKPSYGNTNSARKQLFTKCDRTFTDVRPVEQRDGLRSRNGSISPRDCFNKSPVNFSEPSLKEQEIGKVIFKTDPRFAEDVEPCPPMDARTFTSRNCDENSAKQYLFERRDVCQQSSKHNERVEPNRRYSFDETDSGLFQCYSYPRERSTSTRPRVGSEDLFDMTSQPNNAKRKIDFDSPNDVFREEKRQKQSCTCSLMEEQFMQMAEFGYRNIRRQDTSQASFEHFRRELNQTNGVLKESVEIIREIKNMCECRHVDRETLKRQLMTNFQFLKS